MLKVADSYRLNQLSLRPGGSTVILVHSDGRQLSYDKIKNPGAYIRKSFIESDIIGAYIDNTETSYIENQTI